MKKTLLFSAFILFTLSAYCQEEIVLQGKLLNDSTQVSNIHIVNLSNQSGTVTNSSGQFEIIVRQRDTLLFTSIQHNKKEIIITEEIFTNSYLEIELNEEVNELDEVNISNISLSGNLSQDISNMEIVNKYNLGVQLNTEPLPTPEERRLYTATAGGILSVDMLINSLSGRLKKLKNEKEISDLRGLVKKGMQSLGETYFTENLNLLEEEVVNFLYYCAENSNMKAWLGADNDLQLMEYFERMAKEYKNFKEG